MDDVLIEKFASLERCLTRIKDEYSACKGNIQTDILRQDSIILNIERACEQCFDMGQRVIRQKKLGLAKEYRDIFTILHAKNIIPETLATHLKSMVGFRNLAIHEYTSIDIDKLKHIIENRLSDLHSFAKLLITL
ncbi:MAG: hypothetical protein A3F18_08280 [Legionellales bacterium RIFCSPHIGHO2_12_FULL_37_14]|nr:MAG: hypothetical protein A3F18_08280 [Legionellales bacterium RIFCSPHIGHO2_12_FULL_37_14]